MGKWVGSLGLPLRSTFPWLACLAVCRANDVDVVTLGQYMRPTKKHMAVAEYVTPDAFAAYQKVRPAGQRRQHMARCACRCLHTC